jgi:membrane protein YqaA with SNARE-associated domain
MFQAWLEKISVFVASALNLNYGLGLSVTYDLSRLELFLLLSTGSVSGVFICLLIGGSIQRWWKQRYDRSDASEARSAPLALRIWRRYGLWGLAFSAFLMGPIPPVAVSLLSGMRRQNILLYLGAGKFFWSAVFAYFGYEYLLQFFSSIF